MSRTWRKLSLQDQSIARRLFVSSAAWSLAILLIAGVILSTIYRSNTERGFDERLHVYLKSLVAVVASPDESDRPDPFSLGEPRFDLPLSGWYWQITRIDRLPPEVKGSTSLFGGRLPPLPQTTQRSRPGELREGYAVGPDERQLRMVERVIDLGEDGRFLIQVAADAAEIESTITSFRWALGFTFVLLALALAATTLFQVRFGLMPLSRLSAEVGAIRRGQAERVEGRYPDDLSPLAAEVNLLIDSNREILDRARTQVGNLAHALKTPLSVIVNEAAPDRGALGDKVREQAAIMRDQVSWYLERARAAARAGSVGAATDIAPVVDGILRTSAKIYRDRDVAFAREGEPELRFRGERQDLEEMVGNLVDNAGKWAASRVLVTVGSAPDKDGRPFLRVLVDDDGPGLPGDVRDEMLRRGVRLDESKPGSGLGLSIVADLAGLYGGRLTLDDSPLGGLRASLVLPAV
ncbi:sensor histidine kinase [Alsobacter sp. SYSU M60028]|uniref:histidine kinase n=1 Tax=Alsobacter ponti TaxID=2962936 RepID=A0ABT1L8E3_9HYPH|nr:sensor histidine kinase [Alsobacter ponti]MCP8937732.1 sensor histidine kinase [Alsobacter ponti]